MARSCGYDRAKQRFTLALLQLNFTFNLSTVHCKALTHSFKKNSSRSHDANLVSETSDCDSKSNTCKILFQFSSKSQLRVAG